MPLAALAHLLLCPPSQLGLALQGVGAQEAEAFLFPSLNFTFCLHFDSTDNSFSVCCVSTTDKQGWFQCGIEGGSRFLLQCSNS